VAVVDAHGNTVTHSSALVTLAIASGPAGARLEGHTTLHAVHGVATFSDLSLNVAGSYVLKATGGNLTPDLSFTFTVLPAAVTKDVAIHRGNWRAAGTRGSYEQTLTLTNISDSTLKGPLMLLLGPLPNGLTLTNATETHANRPSLDVLAIGGSLLPGKSVKVTLKFSGAAGGKDIAFSLDVMQGIS
jgi:hypothetical protein